MIGYMLTWRTYGTWVDGEAYCSLRGEGRMNRRAVLLNEEERKIVHNAILGFRSEGIGKIEALAVGESHVHLVMRAGVWLIDDIVAALKTAGRKALCDVGFEGKVWAKSFDKQYCFDRKEMTDRILYVERHELI